MKKRNFIAKELRNPKFRSKIVKSKKGKGSYKRKKKNN
jgi:stalled ribosome alternative rescue factor ArfA|tara:strand:- start:230 stop:343 length:114 start_codon:yes stop_codon:yes gene_type:complete